jgi:hypothetical protein
VKARAPLTVTSTSSRPPGVRTVVTPVGLKPWVKITGWAASGETCGGNAERSMS